MAKEKEFLRNEIKIQKQVVYLYKLMNKMFHSGKNNVLISLLYHNFQNNNNYNNNNNNNNNKKIKTLFNFEMYTKFNANNNNLK